MGATTHAPARQDRAPPSTAAPFSLHLDGKGIDIKQWTIQAVERHIASTAVEEQMSNLLGIKLPGMLFDSNTLCLRFAPKRASASADTQQAFELSFTALDALKMVGNADPSIRVRAAVCWEGKNRRSDVEVTKIEHASDWTFSTKYKGTIKPSPSVTSVETTSAVTEFDVQQLADSNSLVSIDYNALRNTQLPILYSSHIILFEDELDDNGTASYKVRIRVMPTFFFILARFFLRVDGVLLRVYDTRYYHQFGSGVLVRETSTKEARLDSSWASVHPSVLRDPDLVSQRLPKISSTLENIQLVL
ncbi:TIP41-like protein [Gracilaria domingensis]|nr:TIP41-like protein [Gracilaria domingensis]